jgi:hypothetical protein
VITNGSKPRPPVRRLPGSRRVRLAVGVATGLVIAGVLVAPVVLLGTGSGTKTAPCSAKLLYKGNRYTARQTDSVVQAIAIGVGVASGCGTEPSNVNLRSLPGVKPAVAVALASDASTVYVRAGLCLHATGSTVLPCLRARSAG